MSRFKLAPYNPTENLISFGAYTGKFGGPVLRRKRNRHRGIDTSLKHLQQLQKSRGSSSSWKSVLSWVATAVGLGGLAFAIFLLR